MQIQGKLLNFLKKIKGWKTKIVKYQISNVFFNCSIFGDEDSEDKKLKEIKSKAPKIQIGKKLDFGIKDSDIFDKAVYK
jgi:hypothetical protein